MKCFCILALAFASAAAGSAPLTLRLNFAASVEQTWVEYRSHAAPPKHTKYSMAVSDSLLALRMSPLLTDGRPNDDLQLFGQSYVNHFQPFFDEIVCYKFDLALNVNNDAAASWRAATYHAMGIYEDLLNQVKIEGTGMVEGTPCATWVYSAGTPGVSSLIAYKLYVDDQGVLRAVNLTMSYPGYTSVTTTFFRNYTSEPSPAAFLPGDRCVDLRQGQAASDESFVNDKERIALANTEAQGHWHAAPSPAFEGLTLAAAKLRLGADVKPLRLPLKEAAQLQAFDIPDSFDARKHWKQCRSISSIRNQGNCGACWAFAATEAFNDRLCINGNKSNFVGSVEYMVNCDMKNNGCGGGLVDDAWMFLRDTGVPTEGCFPYSHCPKPKLQNCGIPENAALASVSSSCPAKCHHFLPLRRTKATSAYAVAKPGNVAAMQREILQHGPIESTYFVFSDFPTYSHGTYFRTPSATGPMGGHAVKILGWGVDSEGVDYWLVANSWSKVWGEQGFFRIRRGTNECGIETTPVAGLVSSQQQFDDEEIKVYV